MNLSKSTGTLQTLTVQSLTLRSVERFCASPCLPKLAPSDNPTPSYLVPCWVFFKIHHFNPYLGFYYDKHVKLYPARTQLLLYYQPGVGLEVPVGSSPFRVPLYKGAVLDWGPKKRTLNLRTTNVQ